MQITDEEQYPNHGIFTDYVILITLFVLFM